MGDPTLEQGKGVTMKEQQMECAGLTAAPTPCAAQGKEVERKVDGAQR